MSVKDQEKYPNTASILVNTTVSVCLSVSVCVCVLWLYKCPVHTCTCTHFKRERNKKSLAFYTSYLLPLSFSVFFVIINLMRRNDVWKGATCCCCRTRTRTFSLTCPPTDSMALCLRQLGTTLINSKSKLEKWKILPNEIVSSRRQTNKETSTHRYCWTSFLMLPFGLMKGKAVLRSRFVAMTTWRPVDFGRPKPTVES